MSEFFRSAFGYFSGTSGEDNDFVGQLVDLGGGNKLKIKKVIAEGGYGFVFIAQDVRSNKLFALKRLIVSKEQVELVKKEISFLKILSGHTNIIQFVAATGVPASKTGHGSAEFLIQTELCTGQLLDIVSNNRLSPRQVLRVFYETCSAVAHMHNQIPPIIHRDLKVENLLLSSRGEIKLCDFGSATTDRIQPDDSWSQSKRGLTEDELQRNTTPMYRAPEMIDLYNNYPIDQRTDIWALGCLLFKLCYSVHPFEDSSKLSIINANYKIPDDDISFALFQPLIKACLVIDPRKRPPVNEIIAHLYSVAQQLNEDLNSEPTDPLPLAETHSEGEWLEQTAQQAQRLFGFVKGGAGHLIKNIKDTSSKMMHTVQTVAGKRTSLDISYITSRILVMSLPSEDQLQGHNLDEVRGFLDARHPEQYLVFNLSDQHYDTTRLHNQVADFDWPSKRMVDLELLVDLCTSVDSWLRADVNNVVVIHCTDGKLLSATVVVAYLVFIGLFSSPLTGYKLFNLKRNQPDGARNSSVHPPASYYRYTQCVADMVHDDDGNYGNGTKPHPHPITIYSIKMTSVPVFSMNRSGCKPFVEVVQNGERIFTSIGQDDMDKLRSYTSEDGEILIPIGVGVCGNILITVHHIRAIPIVKMSGRGMSAVRMFQCQFHTGFVRSDWIELKFSRSELDGSSVTNESKFPSPFNVVMSVAVDVSRQGLSVERCASWKNLPHPQDTPLTCFTSSAEQKSVLKDFSEFDTRARLHHNKKKKLKQQQPHSGGLHPAAAATYHDDPPVIEQQRNDDHPVVSSTIDPTSAGYVAYRDQDELTGSSSSNDSDSDSNIPTAAVLHSDNTSQPQSQFGTLLNLDSPPATTAATSHDSNWISTSQTGDDLAAVFGNPSVGIKTANLLDITSGGHSDANSSSKLTPPLQANRSASSSIEDLLFGGDDTSSSTLQQPRPQRPISADSGDLFGTSNVLLQPQATAYREPVVIGNMGAQIGNNLAMGVTTQLHSGAQVGSNKIPQKSSSATSLTKDDPFAQFVNLQSSSIPSSQSTTPGSSPWPGTSPYPGGSPRSGASPIPPATSGSYPPRYGVNAGLQSQVMGSQYSQAHKNKPYSSSSTTTQATTVGGGPKNPTAKKPQSTNYTSVIGGREERGVRRTANPTGIRPKLNVDDFQDLLGAEGFNVPSKGKEPQTLSDMQDIGDLNKEQDPDRAKVKAWAKGKEKNIRALISSLHLILWEGETRWNEVGMHQLVQPEEVRRYYKKACLVAHPDKLVGLPHENLARQIFIALNEAHTIYEESGGQPLL